MKFQRNKLTQVFAFKKKSSKKRKSISRNRTIFSFENNSKTIKKKHRTSLIQHVSFFYNIKHKILIFFAVIAIWLWGIVYFSSIFRISEIYIESNLSTININRAYENTDYLRGKLIFWVKSNEVIERIQSAQKSIQGVSIQASFPNTLSIFLESHNIILQTDSHVILTNGLILEKIDHIENIPNIQIWEYDENSFILSESLIQKVPFVVSEIEKNIPSRWVETIYLAPPEKEVLIKDTLWTIFIFDLTQNIWEQIKKLSIYQTENAEWLIWNDDYYRDLRITGKIFVCKKTDTPTCAENLNTIYGKNNLSNFLDVFES